MCNAQHFESTRTSVGIAGVCEIADMIIERRVLPAARLNCSACAVQSNKGMQVRGGQSPVSGGHC
jgi:hypothetical protein